MNETFLEFLLWFPAVIVALSLHEFAHAWVADRLGDPTPRALGRVSLNPLVHLDLVGTILLVVFHFGWGRPVPVDHSYLRHPRRDLVLISIAGPAVNFCTAIVVGLSLRWLSPTLLDLPYGVELFLAAQALTLLSLLLTFFNLIPAPPLDGSRVIAGLLPSSLAATYLRHSSLLSWGLIGVIVVGSVSDVHIVADLIYAPSRWLYSLLVGTQQGG